MKKIIRLLLVTILATCATWMYGQERHMNLLMPDWKTTSVDAVMAGSNYTIPGDRTFNGNRATQNDQRVVKIANPYQFPSMVPLIIYAKAPDGAKEVIWDIDTEKVQVVGYDNAARFVSSTNLVTPVLGSSKKVIVENPYRIATKDIYKFKNKPLPTYNVPNWKYDEWYDKGSTESLYNVDFNVPAGYSYIVVIATANTYAHISATSSTNNDKSATSISHIEFIDAPLSLGEDLALSISGGPQTSPVFIKSSGENVIYDIYLINNSKIKVDLTDAVIMVTAEWSGEKQYLALSGELNANGGSTKIVTKPFKINHRDATKMIGVLGAYARVFYPNAKKGFDNPKNTGKSAEMHLSYTKADKPPPTYSLAGIKTKFGKTTSYKLNIMNTAPLADQVLSIVSVTQAGTKLHGASDIDGNGGSITVPCSNNQDITIKYQLWYQNKKMSTIFEISIDQ